MKISNGVKNKGAIITLTLVFGAVFLLLLGGLISFYLLQLKQLHQKIAWNQSLNIAEAGIDYYRWCLNNEVEEQCQTSKDYFDPDGNFLGSFSLEVTPTIMCGESVKKTISSTGWTKEFPQVKRKIKAIYARTSVAQFSYVLNDNVWIGSDHEIRGPYHSNGGIRMDGENQSLMTSAQKTWVCTGSFGCSSCPTTSNPPCQVQGSNCVCPGVFTTTSNSEPDLFSFPVPQFDFVGITIDLAEMKSKAVASGIYLPPSVNINPRGKGYHLIFKDNSVLEVWIITGLSSTYAYSMEEGWHYDNFIITNEYLYGTYNAPSACSVIFVEDNIWPEGKVKGKVAIASANLINPNLDTDVILLGNIEYTTLDGSDGLALAGERNILIGPQSPNILELQGIFIAQKGRFSRNHYPNNFREKLEIYGSIISNGRVGTKWISGSQIVSGYLNRESYFDSGLVYNPPLFTPYIEPDFKILKWEEVKP